jgi:hypothetical protein
MSALGEKEDVALPTTTLPGLEQSLVLVRALVGVCGWIEYCYCHRYVIILVLIV